MGEAPRPATVWLRRLASRIPKYTADMSSAYRGARSDAIFLRAGRAWLNGRGPAPCHRLVAAVGLTDPEVHRRHVIRVSGRAIGRDLPPRRARLAEWARPRALPPSGCGGWPHGSRSTPPTCHPRIGARDRTRSSTP